jgi:hypothetical protein
MGNYCCAESSDNNNLNVYSEEQKKRFIRLVSRAQNQNLNNGSSKSRVINSKVAPMKLVEVPDYLTDKAK